MMFRLFLALLLAPFRAGFCWFGGDSDSSQTTNQFDKRVSGRDGAQVSGDGNTVNVSAIDQGAVFAGTELARAALITSAASFDQALRTGSATVSQAMKGLENAYETGRAGDKQMLSIVGMAVIGMAAIMVLPALFKKG